MRLSRRERVRGGLYGLLIGDAVGVPYEFHAPESLPDRDALDMVPPPDFRRSHHETPPGTWSDDGAQALALLDSLVSCGRLDVDDLGRRFVAWWNEHRYTPYGEPAFDIGNQTSDALERLENGAPAATAGGDDERDNGNGSLMRVLPLALWHQGTDAELVADAYAQSAVTHRHPRSQVICALYALWARRLLDEHPEPYDDAVAALTHLTAPHEAHRAELERALRPFVPRGTGYVLDCFHSARVALRGPDYASVIRCAVAFGLDTDTTAAVAGGIAGLIHGEQGIPAAWRDGLRDREQVEALLARLT